MKTIAFVLVILVATFVEGRHIKTEDWESVENQDIIPMNALFNVKPNRFVPINNALFFKISQPCEKDYKRDAVGVCREVWD